MEVECGDGKSIKSLSYVLSECAMQKCIMRKLGADAREKLSRIFWALFSLLFWLGFKMVMGGNF